MIFGALPNAAYRVSLRDTGAELAIAPSQVVENLEAQQDAG